MVKSHVGIMIIYESTEYDGVRGVSREFVREACSNFAFVVCICRVRCWIRCNMVQYNDDSLFPALE